MQKFYFEIYSVKHGDEYRSFRFASSLELISEGLRIDPANYEQTYADVIQNTNNLTDEENLDFLFQEFNTARPDDFFGHSMSTSDIVRLFPLGIDDSKVRAYFCDPSGWIRLSDDIVKQLPMSTWPQFIRLTIMRVQAAFDPEQEE